MTAVDDAVARQIARHAKNLSTADLVACPACVAIKENDIARATLNPSPTEPAK